MEVRTHKILTREEIQTVLAHLKKRSAHSMSARANLAIFRLSCCCGLRRKEIAGLLMKDIVLMGAKPGIHVRPEITKGKDGKKRSRYVPLWWDRGTLESLKQWKIRREKCGAEDDAPFVCGTSTANFGKALELSLIPKRWRTAINVLGPERTKQLSLHCGRHSFISHALAAGRSLPEVRDAAGHTNISITNCYLHALECDTPDIFG